MICERGCTLFRKGITFVEAEGARGLLKVLTFIITSFFKYEKLVIYETDLARFPDVPAAAPRIENFELKVLSSEEELNSLLNDGYRFTFYPNIKVDKCRFNQGARLIAAFINRKLVFKDWLALTRASAYALGPFLTQMTYEGQAVGDAAETDPKFRGRGIFQYATACKLRYAREMGKTKLLAFVDADNTASRKVQEKAGSVVTHTGFRLRVLYLWDIFRLSPVCQEGLKALKEETDGIRG